MDAKELTKKSYEYDRELTDHKKRIEYLEQELTKLRMLMDDMKVDVAMMQKRG